MDTAVEKDGGAEQKPASSHVLALAETLSINQGRIARFQMRGLEIELLQGRDSLWAIAMREGEGGIAIRAAFLGVEFQCRGAWATSEGFETVIDSQLGQHRVAFQFARGSERIRIEVRFTPSLPLQIPFVPRDLYPLDRNGNPLGTRGNVEAAQRGLNTGLVYFRVDEPAFGTVLYFQNLTALNDYFQTTETKPDGVVGGEWPELGFQLPPTIPDGKPLEAGKEVVLSDALVVVRNTIPQDERESALCFLEMLAEVYLTLDLPSTDFRDWIGRSVQTLRDLETAPEATIRQYGHLYVHPYTGAGYPDIMVQSSIVRAIHDWGLWCGTPHPLEAALKAGLPKFFDEGLGTFRRYLPNVGSDKDKDAVDSWYLYHPLVNLGAMALNGDELARDLFLKSLDFGIEAAHHFEYRWPIQYKITDFSVIVPTANDGRGQTDVGGIYAWVMLEAFSLTGKARFLREACAAMDAAEDLRFNLNYQANLTAWGAAAAVRLWRETGNDRYRDQSYVFLASFFHNCQGWESEIKLAVHYRNFLGATCLQDAPYMAIYECFESYSALQRYLEYAENEVPAGIRMLLTEYCRYALDRAWFYYPDALPEEAIAKKQRDGNGHIDRNLSFPVEDLYADGQPAGQVGQEIYGAGAAFTFATRAFHKLPQLPVRLFSDHFLKTLEVGEKSLTLDVYGSAASPVTLRLASLGTEMPALVVTTENGEVKPQRLSKLEAEYEVTNLPVTIAWAEQPLTLPIPGNLARIPPSSGIQERGLRLPREIEAP